MIRLKEDWWYFKELTYPKYRDKLIRAIVWRLPREVILWATVRLFAHGTTGKYGNTHPDSLTLFEALDRWKGHN